MSEWISVDDGLPEENVPVLIVADGYVQHVAYVRDYWPRGWSDDLADPDFWMAADDVEGDEAMPIYSASHWMPLPEPPDGRETWQQSRIEERAVSEMERIIGSALDMTDEDCTEAAQDIYDAIREGKVPNVRLGG